MVFGVGINDLSSDRLSYTFWHSIIRRCYSSVYQKSKPTYVGVKVSDSWLVHSNFAPWFDEYYIGGWQIDKDLLDPTSRVYSEGTCCFLPCDLNMLIQYKQLNNGLPQGVYLKKSSGKYIGQLSIIEDGIRKSGHLITTSDPQLAFKVYKQAKEKKIKELAEMHREVLPAHVYYALVNFEVQP